MSSYDYYSEYDNSSSDFSSVYDVDICGDVLHSKYVMITPIGKGGFATVWLSYNLKNKKFYAVKVHNVEDIKGGQTEVEFLKIVSNVKCNTVNKMVDYFIHTTEQGEHLCTVFNLMAGTLEDLLTGDYSDGLPLTVVKTVVVQILEAISVLNKNGIIHTDIKPENILIEGVNDSVKTVIDKFKRLNIDKKKSQNFIKNAVVNMDTEIVDSALSNIELKNIKVKLSDFGTCIKKTDCNNFRIQTRYYRSPEVILESTDKYNETCDVWSIGCLTYELITGTTLFDPDKNDDMDRDRYQLYQFTTTLGKIPHDVVSKSDKKIKFFRRDGLLKGVDNLNYQPLYVTVKKYMETDNTPKDITCTVDFIYNTLQYNHKLRPTAEKCLHHTWCC